LRRVAGSTAGFAFSRTKAEKSRFEMATSVIG
jgi:hypothetical protein